ncbi:hypothetical protein [Streptomyces rimosus]|uniref:hypothetical protein n=1 Tax=Streptomyces rimosus TaxID=1927 RepID=UPI0004C6FFF9|nr:hypothetical protein [Streptomyces rimosus]
MSDEILSVIPADPYWQPGQAAADRCAALLADPAFGARHGQDVEIDVSWHDPLRVIDCGQNLERIGCPHCGAEIDPGQWSDLVSACYEDEFATLAIRAPCCGTATTLDALDYDWPCGFARFQIAIRNSGRAGFADDEMTALADALGHPVRQVRTRI